MVGCAVFFAIVVISGAHSLDCAIVGEAWQFGNSFLTEDQKGKKVAVGLALGYAGCD
jgi:hypothetical protein